MSLVTQSEQTEKYGNKGSLSLYLIQNLKIWL